jgi:BirA family biotin operon repressor/biotin-[acetyl-CoA-carboxylase] ligase
MEKVILEQYLAKTPVKNYRCFDTIDSTNTEALKWADEGAEDFSLVISEEQTQGRGRFNRKWITAPGSSLAFSLILIPTSAEYDNIPLFAPLCGIAIQESLFSLYGLNAEIKWPNDVLLDRKKTAGVLVEAAWVDQKSAGIILGIGINISQKSVPPVLTQLYPATCVEEATGHPVDRFLVLQSIINSIQKWRLKIGTDAFMSHWQAHLAYLGEWVRIEHSGKSSIIGKVIGIDGQGRLVLKLEDQREEYFEIGDVHLRTLLQDQIGGPNAG